ncbi:hypothetical protein JOD57_004638 [Geodermatophilus bullaregiensis]|uniref:hypothetical protein n=1 Tax=Geodermatophilus bullaregiensis TaxID=1564160 RepID=UPI001956BC31|nr:hypothetical protein [Geodermatophilus bullaregiensis]MBM7808801.1 hypothetical protein [Geodermatophilus bullaregiensis]
MFRLSGPLRSRGGRRWRGSTAPPSRRARGRRRAGGDLADPRRLPRTTSDLLRRRPEPGLLLLADLRHVHREAAGVSLDRELSARAAQGARRRDLFELAERCQPDALRRMRWADAELEESAIQALVS